MEDSNLPNLPNPLTKNQVEAVRFQVTKPGYSFEQVESFIDKTKATLEFLEREMRKDKLALAEAEDEIELLTERAQTLSATLEIFKVKGDAVVSASGDFVTENTVAKNNQLETENEYLKNQIISAQEDANAGWQAEAELRKYIEEQLLPWLDANKEAIVKNSSIQESPISADSKKNNEKHSWADEDIESSDETQGKFVLAPEDISYDEELSHDEHVPIADTAKPLLSSSDSEEWFK